MSVDNYFRTNKCHIRIIVNLNIGIGSVTAYCLSENETNEIFSAKICIRVCRKKHFQTSVVGKRKSQDYSGQICIPYT